MTGEINPNQPSQVFIAGKGLQKRLAMLRAAREKRNGSLFREAGRIAEESIKAEERASGNKPSTARACGRRLGEWLRRTLGITTDSTGQTAECLVNKTEQDQVKAKEERKKYEEQKYGGSPTLPEVLLHGIADAGEIQLDRRELLVGKPKEAAREVIGQIGPDFLPWPLSTLARIFGIFKWRKK